jgi:exocyst complex component 4
MKLVLLNVYFLVENFSSFSCNVSLYNLRKSECQQLICEILRATPEAASADASVQTARLASKAPSKGKKWVTLISNSFPGLFMVHFLLGL